MTMGERIKYLRKKANMTQAELGAVIGVQKAAIMKYEKGNVENIKRSSIKKMAELFNVTPSYLMGLDDELEQYSDYGILPIRAKKLPILGEIACGKPIYADEEYSGYVTAEADMDADFCLIARGDSMIGARILDGDVVFIKKDSSVNNGEIAAVIIGDEATLKRVYYYPDKSKLVLNAESPRYEPLVYIGEELEQIHILGKAVAFQSVIK